MGTFGKMVELSNQIPQGPSLDRLIAATASKQRRNITREQLLDLGLDSNAIKYRTGTGRLHRVYQGVYAVGCPPQTPAETAAAAVLACGPGAGLSGLSAAAHWGIWPRWPETPEVIAPRERRRRGISTYCTTLPGRDLRRHLSIRVTSPARTLLDCAPKVAAKQRIRMVNSARVNKWTRVSDDQIADIVARNPQHRGAKALRWFIEEDVGHRSESELEDILYPWCDHYALPRPVTQVSIGQYRVDALFAAEKVVLELDGWDAHRGRESFESDRDRDATLAAQGFLVVRITWERFKQDPRREAERLAQILAARRRTAA